MTQIVQPGQLLAARNIFNQLWRRAINDNTGAAEWELLPIQTPAGGAVFGLANDPIRNETHVLLGDGPIYRYRDDTWSIVAQTPERPPDGANNNFGSLAIDSQETLYITNRDLRQVQRYTGTAWESVADYPEGVTQILGLEVDANDNLLATVNPGNVSAVYTLDRTTNTWDTGVPGPDSVQAGFGLAIDRQRGDWYWCDVTSVRRRRGTTWDVTLDNPTTSTVFVALTSGYDLTPSAVMPSGLTLTAEAIIASPPLVAPAPSAVAFDNLMLDAAATTSTPTLIVPTPVAPVFAPDAAPVIWITGQPITPVTVPAPTGTPAPTLAVVGSLPDGITFDADSRVISGTPENLRVSDITIRATNSAGSAEWNQPYTIRAPLVLSEWTAPADTETIAAGLVEVERDAAAPFLLYRAGTNTGALLDGELTLDLIQWMLTRFDAEADGATFRIVRTATAGIEPSSWTEALADGEPYSQISLHLQTVVAAGTAETSAITFTGSDANQPANSRWTVPDVPGLRDSLFQLRTGDRFILAITRPASSVASVQLQPETLTVGAAVSNPALGASAPDGVSLAPLPLAAVGATSRSPLVAGTVSAVAFDLPALTAQASTSNPDIVAPMPGAILFGGTLSAGASTSNPSLQIESDQINPPLVSLLDAGTTHLTVQWTVAAAALQIISYEVRLDGGAWINVQLAMAWRADGLVPGRNYRVEVRARTLRSVSAPSVPLDVQTSVLVVPPSPRNLRAASTDSGGIELEWDAPRGVVTGYDVLTVDVTGITAGWEAVPSGSTSHRVRGLAIGQPYTFRVRARNDAGPGEPASPIIDTPLRAPSRIMPRGLTVPLIDADRQSLIVRLDDQDCRLHVWWHPSDSSWWASIEVPANTPAIQGRRLALNAGLLDRIDGILAGNLVVREIGMTGAEPGRDAWMRPTHALIWEPDLR